jgi:hypothetical protein
VWIEQAGGASFVTVSKETCYSVKRDLLQCQKRPIIRPVWTEQAGGASFVADFRAKACLGLSV